MTVSIDIHPPRPGRELRIEARGLNTAGDPLWLQISDDQGNHVAEVTLFMGDNYKAKVLAGAINALMRSLTLVVEDTADEVLEKLQAGLKDDGQV